ncbi:MAG: hypothetical protein ACN6I4_00085 [bacterium]
MIEQIITTIVIVLLNLSIYNLTGRKGDRKRRISIFLIALSLVFITFLIPFNPEYFFIKNNIFLVMYSLGLIILVGISKLSDMAILPIFDLLPNRDSLKIHLKILKLLFSSIPVWITIMATIFQMLLIWDLEFFSELTDSL